MPRILHLRGLKSKSLRLSKHGKITQPSAKGGATKQYRNGNDESYHTNLGLLRNSLKSLNISKPKHKSKYIEF